MCGPSSFKSPSFISPNSSLTLEREDISNTSNMCSRRAKLRRAKCWTSPTALLVCRLSDLAFYHLLCELHDRLSLAIKCALLLLIAAYLPQMCLIIFHCKPVTGLWPYPWELRSVDHIFAIGAGIHRQFWPLSFACSRSMSA